MPLQVRAETWTNRNGYKAAGYILYPRDFRPDTRYPAIVITHGFDADERFAKAENQWNYPAQLLAARGYVDLNLSLAASKAASIRLGVNNLTDRKPPLVTSFDQSNTLPTVYDVLGRSFYIGFTGHF